MDQAKVKLVWVTPNAEELILYMARVSNPTRQNDCGRKGLLKYLIENKHWSPFEMVSMCVEINTTRAISAQILRHRSFSFQEFSQRYASIEEISTSTEVPKLRRQDTKNRQNSIDNLSKDVVNSFDERIQNHINESMELYRDMLNSKVAKECARAVLPMCTPTRMYMAGTLRSWIHYIQLRTGNGTQYEHQLIALEILNILQKEFPTITKSLGLTTQ